MGTQRRERDCVGVMEENVEEVCFTRGLKKIKWKSTGIHEEEAAVSGGEPLLKPVMVCSLCRSAAIISHSPLGLKEQTEVLSHTDT